MRSTTAAILARICEEKGIDLDKKLKNDVDTVLNLITDELVEQGVAAKLDNLEKIVTAATDKYNDAVDKLAKRLREADTRMNELGDLVNSQRLAVESLIGRDGRRFMLPRGQERAQAARDIYAGMLDDSMRSLDKDMQHDPAIIAACIEAASLVAWRFIDGPRPPVGPESRAQDFPGLKLKPQQQYTPPRVKREA